MSAGASRLRPRMRPEAAVGVGLRMGQRNHLDRIETLLGALTALKGANCPAVQISGQLPERAHS